MGHLVAQLGNPAKAERLMDFGGSFVHFGGVAFQVRGLRSAYPKLWDTACKSENASAWVRPKSHTSLLYSM